MNADEILKAQLNRLETIPDSFSDKVSKAQLKIFEKVRKSLRQLTTNNGAIELTQDNFAKINNILSDYESAIKGSGYFNDLKNFVGEFAKQKSLNDEYLSTVLEGFKPSKRTDLIYTAGEQTAQIELGSTAIQNSSDLLRNMINNSVINGDNILDLTENVSLSIKGNSEIDGALYKTAKLKSSDIYSASERGYTTTIAKEFGIEFYQYTGGQMDTTRCFCKQRHGRVFHIEEIKAWGRKEDLGVCNIGNGWAGMAKGTNENTIFSLAGGYKCHHSFVPKGIIDVSTAVLRRAIDKKYISLADLPKDVQARVE